MKLKHLLAGAAFAAAALAGATASAGIIFDDGATNGTINGFFIDGPNVGPFTQSISDTFTATGSGTLGELDVGLWVPTGATPTTFTWWLGSAPFDNSIGGGTASLSPADYVFHNNNSDFGYDIYDVTLTGLSSAMMNAGSTYVLTLGNANSSASQSVAWDVNNGPASCSFAVDGNTIGDCGLAGESFTLKSGSSSAPEPATWALMLIGAGLTGAGLRASRGRRGVVAA